MFSDPGLTSYKELVRLMGDRKELWETAKLTLWSNIKKELHICISHRIGAVSSEH